MAIQTKLGRVQGASVFTTTAQAYSGAEYQYVSRNDISPSPDTGIKPMVGDCIIFSNGVVGTVSNVQSSATIGCKTNLFSLKGKDGLNIIKIEQTTTSNESEGTNVVTFTLSDGSTHNVQIKNGKDGGGAGGTNYIANSSFNVNQRGKQIYDEQGTGRVYTLDRWAKNCATGNFVVEKLQAETNKVDNANLPFVPGIGAIPLY